MAKAYIDFNCDEELFETVLANTSKTIRSLIYKKYGKNLYGIGVKEELKRSEVSDYELAAESLKKQISFAQNKYDSGKTLKEIELIIRSISSNQYEDQETKKEDTVIVSDIESDDSYIAAFDCSIEEFKEVFKEIKNEKIKTYISMYYGIDCKKLSIEEISKLENLDFNIIENYISLGNMNLKNLISEMNKDKEVGIKLEEVSPINELVVECKEKPNLKTEPKKRARNVITHRKLTEEELDRLFPKQKTIGEMNKKPYYLQ